MVTAAEEVYENLISTARIVTPNEEETEASTGSPISSWSVFKVPEPDL
jgi:hydroxymethylpyrimidine/phosphomethylpyrimidine kinase